MSTFTLKILRFSCAIGILISIYFGFKYTLGEEISFYSLRNFLGICFLAVLSFGLMGLFCRGKEIAVKEGNVYSLKELYGDLITAIRK